MIGGGPIGVLIATRRPPRRRRGRGHRARAGTARADRGAGLRHVDPRDVDQVPWVEEWTGGAGADVVFEVSGAAAAVLGATALAKVRGTLVVVAIHPTPREIDLQRVFWRELRILGARVYERADFETAVELLRGRRDSRRPADQPSRADRRDRSAAFDDLESGRALKILVDVAGDAR